MMRFFVSRRTSLFVGLGALLLILGVCSIYHNYWIIPHRHIASVKAGALTPKEMHELRNSIRQTFVQALGVLGGVIGGVALLGGLYFTARTLRTSQETLRTTQEGQITERFTKAIEHLGDIERLTVRLGGIYALERIARDSPGDHWQIMEVLTAYVRDNAPWRPQSTPAILADSTRLSPKPATDIQAVLTVLGHRIRSAEREGENTLNLAGTDLRGAFLAGAHLEGAFLAGAHLEGAFLDGAHLECASLLDARLDEASLYNAHLEGASGLTFVQLATVYTLKGASLDPPLLAQLQGEYPELFGRV